MKIHDLLYIYTTIHTGHVCEWYHDFQQPTYLPLAKCDGIVHQ